MARRKVPKEQLKPSANNEVANKDVENLQIICRKLHPSQIATYYALETGAG